MSIQSLEMSVYLGRIIFGQYLMLVCETGLEVYGIYAS
jgi:hypothetical protein